MFPKSSTCFALVGAATAENISPDVLFLLPPATTMSLMFLAGSATSGGDVSYPGGMLESETKASPALFLPNPEPIIQPPFVLIIIDPLALSPKPNSSLLHWLIANIISPILNPRGIEFFPPAVDPQSFAPCLSPNPTRRTRPVHDYAILLFTQPDCCTIPQQYQQILPIQNEGLIRLGFSLDDFVQNTKLGRPIAATRWQEKIPDNNL